MPIRISIRSASTPKNGPVIIVGTKLKKVAKPTKAGELETSHASHAITILCIHTP